MRRQTKKWLAAASFLLIIGLIMAAAGMNALSWDFTRLNTAPYETNTHEISEAFSNLEIQTDTADILFLLSSDDTCKVTCFEEENARHVVSVQNGMLTIQAVNQKEWYDYIGIQFSSPKITISLPRAEYGALSIWTDTGDIELKENIRFTDVTIKAGTGDILMASIAAASLDLSVSTGDISVSQAQCDGDIHADVSTGDARFADVTCKNFSSRGSTGDISLQQVIAAEKLSVKRSTGDVRFDRCDAGEIFIQCNTGDVEGTLLSDKIFFTETSTGDVDTPAALTGGKCEIITSTGDIKISIVH